MRKPIYCNKQHEVIVDAYLYMVKDFVREVSSESRYESFAQVLDILIEYHNNYGKGVRENNYWDWLMILPINLSLMANGYFAGIETKRNTKIIHSYRILLNDMVQDVVDKIEKLEPVNE